MARISHISIFLNKELGVTKYRERSRNGLQVTGNPNVIKIGFAVDACMDVFKAAKKLGCQMIVVHHGLLWKGEKDSIGIREKRRAYLKKHGISLYAAHLPLDIHPKYGNNAQIAGLIGLRGLKKFGRHRGYFWGYSGMVKRTSVRNIVRKLGFRCAVLPFGKQRVTRVAVLSGGGAFAIAEAKKKGIDLLITGETSHMAYHTAKDAAINIIFGGHYQTETYGVRALMPLLRERFKIEAAFIDMPTGL